MRIVSVITFVLVLVAGFVAQVPQPTPLVKVPDVNGRAVTLVKPQFPDAAMAAGADGAGLTVKIVVDEVGNVVSAKCSLTCHPMLTDAAEIAAAASKFEPLIRNGNAVSYEGLLLYTYVVAEVNWFRFATALESTRQFDNISVGPVAQMLSKEYANEKAILLGLDAKGTDFEVRQKGIARVEESIKQKLKDDDLWRFELGVALRRVTFWPMAGERTNRTDLQNAINALAPIIAKAPDNVPEQIINDLKLLTKYHVPADLPESELRQAINAMTRNIRL